MATQTQDILTTERPRGRHHERQQRNSSDDNKFDRIARGLGWFSIGLGLAEVVAPRTVARIAGTRKHTTLIRSYGLREITAGIGILSTSRPAGWLWARVAGDVVDLASLGRAASDGSAGRGKSAFAIASVAGITALDICCAKRLSSNGAAGSARAEANMIIDRPAEECYRLWRNFENLPKFMTYLERVHSTGDRVSHWVAIAPGGARIEWDSEITDEVPGQRITWRSLPGSDVHHSGTVNFEPAPGGRGAIVRLQLDYGPSAGPLGFLAKMLGKDPESIIRKELRRFKQVMETGEVIKTEGQPAGRANSVTWLDNLAR